MNDGDGGSFTGNYEYQFNESFVGNFEICQEMN